MTIRHSCLRFILEIPCMLLDYCDLRTSNRLALLRTSRLLYGCNSLTLTEHSQTYANQILNGTIALRSAIGF